MRRGKRENPIRVVVEVEAALANSRKYQKILKNLIEYSNLIFSFFLLFLQYHLLQGMIMKGNLSVCWRMEQVQVTVTKVFQSLIQVCNELFQKVLRHLTSPQQELFQKI